MNANRESSNRSSGLARGLSTLIPRSTSAYQELECDVIEPNPSQPRQHFDDEQLRALAESIAEIGVLQPVIVRALPDAGRYALIAGERRWRAAKLANVTVIPAIVRQANDADTLVEAIVENVHREDLDPLEEAAAYRQLIDDFDLTHDQVGKRVGKSRATITNSLRLLALPASVQAKVRTRELTAGHARVLAGVTSSTTAKTLAERAIGGGLSVRQLEQLAASETSSKKPRPPQRERNKPANARLSAAELEAQNVIAEALSTDVAIEPGRAGAGRVTIRYADLADLERISHQISV